MAAIAAAKPEGTTLNDVLLAAVALTIAEWNRNHDKAAGKVQMFMPASVRPADWSTDIVSNLFSYVSINSTAGRRADLRSAIAEIAEQTQPVRRAARSGGTQDLLRLLTPVPARLKKAMPRLLDATAHRFVDTAVVSNLGRPALMPSFDGKAPSEVQFTPPYWSAAAISVGAVSSGGFLHLGLRHRLNVLDGPAAAEFADLLTSTVGAPA